MRRPTITAADILETVEQSLTLTLAGSINPDTVEWVLPDPDKLAGTVASARAALAAIGWTDAQAVEFIAAVTEWESTYRGWRNDAAAAQAAAAARWRDRLGAARQRLNTIKQTGGRRARSADEVLDEELARRPIRDNTSSGVVERDDQQGSC